MVSSEPDRRELAEVDQADAKAHDHPLRPLSLPPALRASAPRGIERRTTTRARRRLNYRRHKPFRKLTHSEMIDALVADHRRKRGRQKMRRDRINNVIAFVELVQGWACARGSGVGATTRLELVRALKEPEATWDDVPLYWPTVKRWARNAQSAGLAGVRALEDPLTGADNGLEWFMLDPRLHCQAPAGVAQSVRAAES